MSNQITLYCPNCHVKLKATLALLGRVCPCPKCRHRVVVQLPTPSDADIALVPDLGRESALPRVR